MRKKRAMAWTKRFATNQSKKWKNYPDMTGQQNQKLQSWNLDKSDVIATITDN